MLSIKYNVEVSYKDYLGEELKKTMTFFALNDEEAISIARELFLLSDGVHSDIKIVPKAEVPSDVVERDIDRQLVCVLHEIEKLYSEITYVDFMNMFLKFGGSDLNLKSNTPSYVIDFMNFKMRLILRGNKCIIDRDEIVYTDTESSRIFVIRGGIIYYGN